jgi:phage terminase large subunit-like protein
VAELNFELLKWQREVFADPTRFKVIAAGRRCGKSRLSAITLLIEGLNCPSGSSVMYVAPTLGQARTILWDLIMDIGRPVIKSAHINNLEITLINDRKILIRGADNSDSLRGVSLSYLVMDEVAFIKPDIWERVLRAALSDKKGRAMFISTPSGRNHFYEWYQLGQSGVDEDWKSWHFTTADNETIDPKEIEAAKRTLSSFAFNQEYLSSFNNAGSGLFKEEWIKFGEEPKDGSWYMAVDLSGFEEIGKKNSNKRLDKSAIACVKVTDDGAWFVDKVELGRWTTEDTALRILKNIEHYRPLAVGIERGIAKQAVMGPLSEAMRRHNCYAHIHDLTHGNRKKQDRVVWALQGPFEHGRITLNAEGDFDVLVDELLMFPTAGVHDDTVDALSYIEQIAITTPVFDGADDDWKAMDVIAGY